MTSIQNTLRCPACAAALLPEDRFCEQCGTRLTATLDDHRSEGGCTACGAPPEAIDEDEHCSRCGARWRSPEDRQEIDVGVAAGVSDRGRLRRRNEDALYVQSSDDGVAVVVCDGISSSLSPHVAARRAASTAGHALTASLLDGQSTLESATAQAIHAAQQAVVEVRWTSRSKLDVPSCTLVCALCRDGELAVGWVGDSRAYWIDGERSRQLTVDHSWAQEQVASGQLSAGEARVAPRAHEITRWLGRDAPEGEPEILTSRSLETGRLVLCSDGLWNYVPGAREIAALVDALPSGAAPVALARALADAALVAGGRDNITVTVIDLAPSTGDGNDHLHS